MDTKFQKPVKNETIWSYVIFVVRMGEIEGCLPIEFLFSKGSPKAKNFTESLLQRGRTYKLVHKRSSSFDDIRQLRIGSWLVCVYRVMDARECSPNFPSASITSITPAGISTINVVKRVCSPYKTSEIFGSIQSVRLVK